MNEIFYRFTRNEGQSLVELVIALSLFALLLSALLVFSANGLVLLDRSSHYQKSLELLGEGEEALRSIQGRYWNSLDVSQTALATSSFSWTLQGEGGVEKYGEYERRIFLEDLYRDSDMSIVQDVQAGAKKDYYSKYATIQLSWSPPGQKPILISREMILTQYNAKLWRQDDWSGGDGQLLWNENNKYYATDLSTVNGEIRLPQIATTSYQTSGYLESSSFDAGAPSSFTVIDWEELDLGCSSCDIMLQIKTAADNNGSPGIWTGWTGGTTDSYFHNPEGNIVKTEHNGSQWIKYRVIMSGDGKSTPSLKSINISYQQ